MPCYNCGKEKVVGRGLCSACYGRLRRNGDVKRKYVINSGKCSVDGCKEKSFSKNLCNLHYSKHRGPIYRAWISLRNKNPDDYPPHWDSYEAFFSEIGEKPTPGHQLRRRDPSKPWSKENIHWLAPLLVSKDHMTPGERSKYNREWMLRKRFNISSNQFSEMLASQGGVCAICGRPETHKGRKGKPKHLSVDHCHSSDKIRGILCVSCNRGIGYFEDKIERLRAAIVYLERQAI